MRGSILISGGKEYNKNYVDAITKSSGNAIYEYCPKYKEKYIGLVLAGGYDMDPVFYRQNNHASKGIDIKRDEAELLLLDQFVHAQKPVLGICRGHQTINVYFGGDLIQDIYTKSIHQKEGDAIHKTITKKDSVLYRLYGTEFATNSNHHQAIGKIGEGIDVTQYSNDGVIEAIEHSDLPIYGVQWHPERMCYDNLREDTVDSSKFMKWFVNLCNTAGESYQRM
ncbi:gamma-glutamyl-gamma-aminobutyrate hydrolase family protein [Anaeromicropila herbilytica]|uniref:Gamma-glutamyl-gamma-aminobutyrate hydrolase n=1 Tax=Anaeromicropila herbilytica TaxID=2785025 RepID=A0A7R7IC83_9FIRM|nr:gamma-glutamyl-gamma-aminobutyrate hydrolase family protein [Anaeromicropila herbilytica]BCN30322.1 gamma-glutamyl-gamma-aminobutyrate hydrolase [Anaeromicropila herbilytica]